MSRLDFSLKELSAKPVDLDLKFDVRPQSSGPMPQTPDATHKVHLGDSRTEGLVKHTLAQTPVQEQIGLMSGEQGHQQLTGRLVNTESPSSGLLGAFVGSATLVGGKLWAGAAPSGATSAQTLKNFLHVGSKIVQLHPAARAVGLVAAGAVLAYERGWFDRFVPIKHEPKNVRATDHNMMPGPPRPAVEIETYGDQQDIKGPTVTGGSELPDILQDHTPEGYRITQASHTVSVLPGKKMLGTERAEDNGGFAPIAQSGRGENILLSEALDPKKIHIDEGGSEANVSGQIAAALTQLNVGDSADVVVTGGIINAGELYNALKSHGLALKHVKPASAYDFEANQPISTERTYSIERKLSDADAQDSLKLGGTEWGKVTIDDYLPVTELNTIERGNLVSYGGEMAVYEIKGHPDKLLHVAYFLDDNPISTQVAYDVYFKDEGANRIGFGDIIAVLESDNPADTLKQHKDHIPQETYNDVMKILESPDYLANKGQNDREIHSLFAKGPLTYDTLVSILNNKNPVQALKQYEHLIDTGNFRDAMRILDTDYVKMKAERTKLIHNEGISYKGKAVTNDVYSLVTRNEKVVGSIIERIKGMNYEILNRFQLSPEFQKQIDNEILNIRDELESKGGYRYDEFPVNVMIHVEGQFTNAEFRSPDDGGIVAFERGHLEDGRIKIAERLGLGYDQNLIRAKLENARLVGIRLIDVDY